MKVGVVVTQRWTVSGQKGEHVSMMGIKPTTHEVCLSHNGGVEVALDRLTDRHTHTHTNDRQAN